MYIMNGILLHMEANSCGATKNDSVTTWNQLEPARRAQPSRKRGHAAGPAISSP